MRVIEFLEKRLAELEAEHQGYAKRLERICRSGKPFREVALKLLKLDIVLDEIAGDYCETEEKLQTLRDDPELAEEAEALFERRLAWNHPAQQHLFEMGEAA